MKKKEKTVCQIIRFRGKIEAFFVSIDEFAISTIYAIYIFFSFGKIFFHCVAWFCQLTCYLLDMMAAMLGLAPQIWILGLSFSWLV